MGGRITRKLLNRSNDEGLKLLIPHLWIRFNPLIENIKQEVQKNERRE